MPIRYTATRYARASVNVPFPGFYNSLLSDAIDHEESQFIENRLNESDHETDESSYPEPMRLDHDSLWSALNGASDYGAMYNAIARMYLDAFDYAAAQALGVTARARVTFYSWADKRKVKRIERRDSLRMAFEEMTSPRGYNFQTDRLFALMPLTELRRMFAKSKAEGHETLAYVIRWRFTSCSGFISGYSNRLDDWTSKPLAEWDHNEYSTLLIAALEMAGVDVDDMEREASFAALEDEGAYQAWEGGVDWSKFDAAVSEARAERLAQWLESDESAALDWIKNNPGEAGELVKLDSDLSAAIEAIEAARLVCYRCDQTPDMFGGVQ